MRRTLFAIVVAATVAQVPVWAMAGNQECAETIAASLRDSGQLQDYKIGVKYQDGTVWIRGRVASQEQMNSALKRVLETPGVQRVVNNLEIVSASTPADSSSNAPNAAPSQHVGRSATAPYIGTVQMTTGAFRADSGLRPAAFNASSQSADRLTGGWQTAGRLEEAAADSQTRTHSVEVLPSLPAPTGPALDQPMPSFETGAVAPTSGMMAQTDSPRSFRTKHTGKPGVNWPLGASQPKASPRTTATRSLEPSSNQRAVPPVAAIAAVPVAAVMAPGAAMMAMAQPAGQPAPMPGAPLPVGGMPMQPQYITPANMATPPAQYDQPNMPNYAWPSYAAYPNYAALSYPKQYSPTAWPYIGPFYPYPQVPLGWRSVKLEWHDGWWQLDFDDGPRNQWFSGLFRPPR